MEQPTHCILRKVLWGILLGLGVILTIAGACFWGRLAGGNGSVGMVIVIMLGATALTASCGMTAWAFEPELDKMRKKRELYKKKQGKDLEAEYYAEEADIHSRAIKKRSRAVKEGFSNETCMYCGDVIESNEKFCSKCGHSITLKCPKCNTKSSAGDKFCRNCGESLGKSKQ